VWRPPEPGLHSIVPRAESAGTWTSATLRRAPSCFWVEVAGALFSVGDTHAAQATAKSAARPSKAPCASSLQFDLLKQEPLAYPVFSHRRTRTRHLDARGSSHHRIDPDLMQAARAAVRSMIDLLSAGMAFRRSMAYLLCSVCGDLRISEIVDVPTGPCRYFPAYRFE